MHVQQMKGETDVSETQNSTDTHSAVASAAPGETGSLSHGGSVCMELVFFFMNGKSENKEWRLPVCVCGVVSVSSPENDGSVTASVSEDNAGSDAEENLETKVER